MMHMQYHPIERNCSVRSGKAVISGIPKHRLETIGPDIARLVDLAQMNPTELIPIPNPRRLRKLYTSILL